MKRRNFLEASIPVAAALAFPAWAQSYPSKAVKLVVPYPPGGALDMLARTVANQLQSRLSKPFIVENKPGAGANIGSEFVANAQPDGHTLLLSGPNLAIGPVLYKGMARYDPIASFTHIGQLATMSTVIVVRDDSPYKTLQELLAAARANPGKIRYGTGAGSPSQIAMELLKRSANVDIQYIPYKGSVAVLTDLIGGQIEVIPSVVAGVSGHLKGGRVRALAITSLQRDPMLPEVPTISEIFPEFEAVTWLGISAPKGLPVDVVSLLERQLHEIIGEPEIAANLRAAGMNVAWLDGKKLTAMIGPEAQKYSKVISEANLKYD